MSRFVRSSKYRHVFGKAFKRENVYDNFTVSRSAWDTNRCSVNATFFALCWEAGGGGSFCVHPLDKPGKSPSGIPLVAGHKAPVLDVNWNPFNDNIVGSVSEDGTGKIWQIPDGGITETMTDPAQTLIGHRRKVGSILFHPTASNVVMTTSTDLTIKIWDIESGKANVSVDGLHGDVIQDCQWNYDGSLVATYCKDKKVRVIDPRSASVTSEFCAHEGVKGGRVAWIGDSNRLFTVGFSRTSDRQYGLWDTSSADKPQAKSNIDTSSGLLMPFFDEDTNVMFLAGKGDGNIRYFEITDDDKFVYLLSEYKSSSPQKGMAMMPKRALNIPECEIARFYKVHNTMVEPISFIVPRKSEMFQDDIYVDTRGDEAAISAADWFGGKSAKPKLINLEKGFVPVKKAQTSFAKVEAKVEKPLTEKELKEELEKAQKRVAYLEAEIVKKDARIKELEK